MRGQVLFILSYGFIRSSLAANCGLNPCSDMPAVDYMVDTEDVVKGFFNMANADRDGCIRAKNSDGFAMSLCGKWKYVPDEDSTYVGCGYISDNGRNKGNNSFTITTEDVDFSYENDGDTFTEVLLLFSPSGEATTRLTVDIETTDCKCLNDISAPYFTNTKVSDQIESMNGCHAISTIVDQTNMDKRCQWASLGVFSGLKRIHLSNSYTNGQVHIDAFAFRKTSERPLYLRTKSMTPSRVVSFSPGPNKFGKPSAGGDSSTHTVNDVDGSKIPLGYGGHITYTFPAEFYGKIRIVENTKSKSLIEKAKVEVCKDCCVDGDGCTGGWKKVAEVSNENRQGTLQTSINMNVGYEDSYKYLRVTDISDPKDPRAGNDGFDIDYLSVTTALLPCSVGPAGESGKTGERGDEGEPGVCCSKEDVPTITSGIFVWDHQPDVASCSQECSPTKVITTSIPDAMVSEEALVKVYDNLEAAYTCRAVGVKDFLSFDVECVAPLDRKSNTYLTPKFADTLRYQIVAK